MDIALPTRVCVEVEVEDGQKLMTVYPQQRFKISTIPCELDITSCRRYTIVVDWILEVCVRFRISESTFFLFVELYRRFYSVNKMDTNTLQLFSVACLLIASKFDEILCVSVDDLVYICANAYTNKQITTAEMRVLETLDWKIRSAENTSYFAVLDKLLSIDGSRFSKSQIKYIVYSYVLGVAYLEYYQFRASVDLFEEVMMLIVASESTDSGNYSTDGLVNFVYMCAISDFHKHGAMRMSGVDSDDVEICQELLEELVTSP